MPRGSFDPVEFLEDGAFNGLLSAGDWTDDTSMALCLGNSLIEKRALTRMIKWKDI